MLLEGGLSFTNFLHICPMVLVAHHGHRRPVPQWKRIRRREDALGDIADRISLF
jgi:hypothetical protein